MILENCSDFKYNQSIATQGSTNCWILGFGLRGSGDRERIWGERKRERVCHFDPGKISLPGVFALKMDKIGLKIDQKGLTTVLLYPKKTFFAEVLFAPQKGFRKLCGTYAFRENNSK